MSKACASDVDYTAAKLLKVSTDYCKVVILVLQEL